MRTSPGIGTRSGCVVSVGVLCFSAFGCATTDSENARPRARQAAVQDPTREGEGGERFDPNAISPEKFVELDQFFRNKATQLQFNCYNDEVEKTRKKYQGNITIAVVVLPQGKSRDIKIINSTLRVEGGEPGSASNLEQCVTAEVAKWGWPEVPSAAPYTGSVSFKPAW